MTAFDRAWDSMQPDLFVKARITPEGLVVTHAGMGGVEEGGKRAGLPTFYSADIVANEDPFQKLPRGY